MKKPFIILLLFIIHSSLFIAYAQPTQEWVQRFSGSGYANGISVKLDSLGFVYVLAKASMADSTSGDYCVIKYSATGNFIWSAFYNSPGNLTDDPAAFAVTGAGDIYVTGTSSFNLADHITTVKFNTNGVLLWAKVYYGGGPGDLASDMTLDKQGNVTVFGGTQLNNTLSVALAIKYNTNGDSLWVRKFTQLGQHYSFSNKAAIDDSGSIYSIGSFEPDNTHSYYLTLKYNANGALTWYSTYDNPQHLGDIGFCIAVDTNRNVYVVGTNGVPYPGNANNTLVKINPAGVTQWASVYKGIGGNSGCEYPTGIGVMPDGNSIYYSTDCDAPGGPVLITLRYDSIGDSAWVRTYPIGGTGVPLGDPAALKLDRLGNCYITGDANYQTTGDDYVTIKYLPSGIQQWVATYNGPLTNSIDAAHDIVIDTALSVYVTGLSTRQNTPSILVDAATIKYNQPIGIIPNSNELPKKFALNQNYPNPFNSSTVITYELPKKSNVSLVIYNSIGQIVKTLVNSIQNASYYSIILNAENFASGVYFYSLTADNSIIDTKKFILIK